MRLPWRSPMRTVIADAARLRSTPPMNPVRLHTRRIFGDQLTPVLAYRRLVAPDQRSAPSFLYESVDQGGAIGRYSILGAQPVLEVIAHGNAVTLREHSPSGVRETKSHADDPFQSVREAAKWSGIEPIGEVPPCFCGGWVGMVGFDAVRWLEPGKLPFARAPRDDRGLPDLHVALYRDVVIFDHATKVVHLVCAQLPHETRSGPSALDALETRLTTPMPPLASGRVDLDISARPNEVVQSVTQRGDFEASVRRAVEYIAAGDAFQVVLSQRFVRSSAVDPFDVYRALRIVNPSPYQIYLQAQDCILVAASPEILCRTRGRDVVSRPLAGTRRRGRTHDEDVALAHELLADDKERAEHTMLVDLARNDLGRVSDAGSVQVTRSMEIERFSHVMHISSTVTGRLRTEVDGWDALRAALPVGTVSGAPKVRAIEIIDELEPVRRGPYAGGIGGIGWLGDVDMAIALRMMVIPVPPEADRAPAGSVQWQYHLQAGAGVVLDSDAAREWEETANKAAALARAIDLAESAWSARTPR
ncbi:MAG: anthranilate synthase component I [Planctomycetes bacterium]|nr:anthranilate synthase component I [Planctomycetota bacterium]